MAYLDQEWRHVPPRGGLSIYTPLSRLIRARWERHGLVLMELPAWDAAERAEGREISSCAETMIGLRRLDHLEACLEVVLRDGVPGDVIETGVWRGGAVIFMRAVLKAYGDEVRLVWAADSFAGFPPPDPEQYPDDRGARFWTRPELAVDVETVRRNFARYGLLDDRVRFLVGWFKDTLPTAPITQLALMRLDGDMYESTMDALVALYPKLAPGGFIIIDDFHYAASCRRAVEDYRAKHGIREPIEAADWSSVFWRKH
jgi:O-methyltransferase